MLERRKRNLVTKFGPVKALGEELSEDLAASCLILFRDFAGMGSGKFWQDSYYHLQRLVEKAKRE